MNKMQERVNSRVWNEELKANEDKAALELKVGLKGKAAIEASKRYARASELRDDLELVTVEEDDLLDTINGEDVTQAVNEIDRDGDVLVIDEDVLLDEINRARSNRAKRRP